MKADLTQRVLEDPSPSHWDALYAWLRAHDHPCARLADAADRTKALRAIATDWFGADATMVEVVAERIQLSAPAHEDGSPASEVLLSFERGHVSEMRVVVRHPDDADCAEDEDVAWVRGSVDRILRDPSGQLLGSLVVTQTPDYGGERFTQWLADTLTECAPLAVRALHWGLPLKSNVDGCAFVEIPELHLSTAMPYLTH